MSLIQLVRTTKRNFVRIAATAALFGVFQSSAHAAGANLSFVGIPLHQNTLTALAFVCLIVATLIILRHKSLE